MMGCSWVDMTKKYERYICESNGDDDSMVASDLKQFAYTGEEAEPGAAQFENSADGEEGTSCYGFVSYLQANLSQYVISS